MKTMLAFIMLVCLVFPSASFSAEQQAQQGRDNKNVQRIEVKTGSDDASASIDEPADWPQDPFEIMRALEARVQQIFNQAGGPHFDRDFFASPGMFQPDINIEDLGKDLTITVDLPGVRKEDIEISVVEDLLTVSGVRNEAAQTVQEDKNRKMYREERFRGGFKRTIRLPMPIKEESIKAKYDQGVLSIYAEKLAPKEPKKINIE